MPDLHFPAINQFNFIKDTPHNLIENFPIETTG